MRLLLIAVAVFLFTTPNHIIAQETITISENLKINKIKKAYPKVEVVVYENTGLLD